MASNAWRELNEFKKKGRKEVGVGRGRRVRKREKKEKNVTVNRTHET